MKHNAFTHWNLQNLFFSLKYYYLFELGYEMLLEKLIQFSNENVINITQQFKHTKKNLGWDRH